MSKPSRSEIAEQVSKKFHLVRESDGWYLDCPVFDRFELQNGLVDALISASCELEELRARQQVKGSRDILDIVTWACKEARLSEHGKFSQGLRKKLEELRARQNGWIAVEAGWPPRHQNVLCLNRDGSIFEGRICMGMHQPFFTYPRGDGSASNTAPSWIDVTHWQPKPAAPGADASAHKSYSLCESGKLTGHWVCECGADLGDDPIDEIDAIFAKHQSGADAEVRERGDMERLKSQVDFLSSMVTGTEETAHIDLDALLGERQRLREALGECLQAVLKADSMLSLIRHRGGIQNWGSVGMATEAEADRVIGMARKMYEKVKAILGASPELS